ncbi:hypothetical protein MTR_2g105590 [Medicago truncatula]|uniref:Uncharacterized protein n=1 Tax=Medicago truncatula TaxID=3880 RepID=G7ZYW5_MEDTR|nr:hypothetical protein MTR_2g105590 [Medicago truncatula]
MFPVKFEIWVVVIGVFGWKLVSARRAICHHSPRRGNLARLASGLDVNSQQLVFYSPRELISGKNSDFVEMMFWFKFYMNSSAFSCLDKFWNQIWALGS